MQSPPLVSYGVLDQVNNANSVIIFLINFWSGRVITDQSGKGGQGGQGGQDGQGV